MANLDMDFEDFRNLELEGLKNIREEKNKSQLLLLQQTNSYHKEVKEIDNEIAKLKSGIINRLN